MSVPFFCKNCLRRLEHNRPGVCGDCHSKVSAQMPAREYMRPVQEREVLGQLPDNSGRMAHFEWTDRHGLKQTSPTVPKAEPQPKPDALSLAARARLLLDRRLRLETASGLLSLVNRLNNPRQERIYRTQLLALLAVDDGLTDAEDDWAAFVKKHPKP
jgi:hypothetical protein